MALCTGCRGTGWITCPTCKGKGYVRWEYGSMVPAEEIDYIAEQEEKKLKSKLLRREEGISATQPCRTCRERQGEVKHRKCNGTGRHQARRGPW